MKWSKRLRGGGQKWEKEGVSGGGEGNERKRGEMKGITVRKRKRIKEKAKYKEGVQQREVRWGERTDHRRR